MKRLLASLLGRHPPQPRTAARKDVCFGDPRARRLQELLGRGNWREAADLFRTVRNWEDRALLTNVAADPPGRPAWLDAWVHERPDEADGYLVRGCQSIQWAWEARTSGMASEVTEEGWKLFFERIDLAFGDLETATELDTEDPTPWGLLVLCSMAAQRDREEASYYLDQAIERDRFHGEAHFRMMRFLCQKWFGSHEEMHEFASRASASAPKGNFLHDLVVIACLENYLFLQSFDELPKQADEYMRSPAVEKLGLAAEEKRFAKGAEGWSEIRSHNTFAGFYYFAGCQNREVVGTTDKENVVWVLPDNFLLDDDLVNLSDPWG